MTGTYKLLDPIRIGNKISKNRIVMPAMECRMNTFDGSPAQSMIDYLEARAKGGTGVIIVENTFVDDRESRSSLNSSGLYSDHQIASKAPLAEAIRSWGAIAIIQLSHGGRQCMATATGLECVAPSPIPCAVTRRMPRELTIEEITRIENAFADAAVRAKKAGFDGVEIHGAHGYLISTFLSPYSNKRTDVYGGSYEGRRRMPMETVSKVREKVGKDFIVGYRINVDDGLGKKGLQPAEACRFISEIEDDIDYVNCSAGFYESGPFSTILTMYEPTGKIVYLAAEMKKYVKRIPVIAVGALNAEQGEAVLKAGKSDLVAFGRQLIAEPELVRKITEGRTEDIRPCCRANEGCSSGFDIGYPMRCELNPSVGREKKYSFRLVRNPKRVTVIGGGPAGMEAARIFGILGHQVILLEKTGRLGGHLYEASLPAFKDRTKAVLEWQIGQLAKSRVLVETNTDATPEKILLTKPDIVVIAVGSEYTVPSVKGKDRGIYALEALENPDRIPKKVVVIGGGLVGIETAMHLAEQKPRDVVVIEMTDTLAPGMDGNAWRAMMRRLEKDGIKVLLSHKLTEITKKTVLCETPDGGKTEIPADCVIFAIGLTARNALREAYASLGVPVIAIGDCVQARNLRTCFDEAWRVAFQMSEFYAGEKIENML
jgi:2,4-dienoyl-CoA reductase-like NADH-dependent reductase (Old Yellow Enzyme family)/thioredoxin reductase